ncbi:MAG: PilZ domain-containing protein [Acidobacteria bacterium]|nr:PilZ domain-containing protein [Acidobacteriota bacterium]
MSKENSADRRRYRRVDTGYPVTLFCQGETYRVKATNLSIGGVFIATKLPLQAGALVHLRLNLPDRSFIQATAQVRFIQAEVGVGVRFLEIAESDLAKIHEIIEKTAVEKDTDDLPGVRLRDTRVRLGVKLMIEGKDRFGQVFTDEVYTEDVSRRGVCLRLSRQVGVGDLLKLSGLEGQFQVEGVVKYTHQSDGSWRVGLHFLTTPKRWVMMGMAVSALSQWEIKPVR